MARLATDPVSSRASVGLRLTNIDEWIQVLLVNSCSQWRFFTQSEAKNAILYSKLLSRSGASFTSELREEALHKAPPRLSKASTLVSIQHIKPLACPFT